MKTQREVWVDQQRQAREAEYNQRMEEQKRLLEMPAAQVTPQDVARMEGTTYQDKLRRDPEFRKLEDAGPVKPVSEPAK